MTEAQVRAIVQDELVHGGAVDRVARNAADAALAKAGSPVDQTARAKAQEALDTAVTAMQRANLADALARSLQK